MKQQKKHYAVYKSMYRYCEYEEIYYGDNVKPFAKNIHVGDTWAVSEKQAINNVKYKNGEHSDYVDNGYSLYEQKWIAKEIATTMR